MKFCLLLFFIFETFFVAAQNAIRCAHSHNDYLKHRPLQGALANGFKSIEIDVFLNKTELKVAHVPLALGSKKNIDELYLRPLFARIEKNNGHVYENDSTPLVLMIDFKTGGSATYQRLLQYIAPYQKYIAHYDSLGYYHMGAVAINISGAVPWEALNLATETRYCTGDGSIDSRNDSLVSATILQRVSSPYSHYFRWRGLGHMPATEKQLLKKLVQEAHAHSRQIRFYAAPQKQQVWRELLDAGVDWINIDKHEKFVRFFTIYSALQVDKGGCHCVRM